MIFWAADRLVQWMSAAGQVEASEVVPAPVVGQALVVGPIPGVEQALEVWSSPGAGPAVEVWPVAEVEQPLEVALADEEERSPFGASALTGLRAFAHWNNPARPAHNK